MSPPLSTNSRIPYMAGNRPEGALKLLGSLHSDDVEL
jgi:hypothetical protein